MQPVRLGDLLLKSRVVDERQLQEAVSDQKKRGGKLGEVLVRLRYLTERQLVEALAQQFHLPLARNEDLEKLPPDVLQRIPAALAHELCVLPLELLEGGRVLAVAATDVLRGTQLEQLRGTCQSWILPRLCEPSVLRKALFHHYGPPTAVGLLPERKTLTSVRSISVERGFHVLLELLVERGLVNESDFVQRLKLPPS